MITRSIAGFGCLLGIAWLLPACMASDAGTPCRYDYHCFSNSCTLGTCDSALGAALFGDDADDDEEREPTSEPEPVNCEELELINCSTAVGCTWNRFCGFEETCAERLRQGLPCPLCPAVQPLGCDLPCMWIERCERAD